jgi:hypothetical protein
MLTTVATGRTTGRAGRLGAATRGLTALLASLMGVNLTLSELTGTDTLVRGTVLLETAVLYMDISNAAGERTKLEEGAYQWACKFQTY